MSIPVNISGSRAAAILGLSQYQTPVSVWLAIMEELTPGFCGKNNYELVPFDGNASTRWGSAFESAIAELTEQKNNLKITDREKFFEKDYLSCHVDGIIDGCLYEAKTTTAFTYNETWGEPGTDKIPMIYQIQIQHNMMLSGLDRCLLSVLVFPVRPELWEEMGIQIVGGPDTPGKQYVMLCKENILGYEIDEWARILAEMGYFHQYEIHANPELQSLMLSKYSHFWTENILGGKVPEPVNYDDIRALCREPIGTILADERITRLMAEYKQIKSEIGGTGPLAKRAEQIKVEVLKYMMDSGAVLDDESSDKWVLRGDDGKKLASYGKDKRGILIFR